MVCSHTPLQGEIPVDPSLRLALKGKLDAAFHRPVSYI